MTKKNTATNGATLCMSSGSPVRITTTGPSQNKTAESEQDDRCAWTTRAELGFDCHQARHSRQRQAGQTGNSRTATTTRTHPDGKTEDTRSTETALLEVADHGADRETDERRAALETERAAPAASRETERRTADQRKESRSRSQARDRKSRSRSRPKDRRQSDRRSRSSSQSRDSRQSDKPRARYRHRPQPIAGAEGPTIEREREEPLPQPIERPPTERQTESPTPAQPQPITRSEGPTIERGREEPPEGTPQKTRARQQQDRRGTPQPHGHSRATTRATNDRSAEQHESPTTTRTPTKRQGQPTGQRARKSAGSHPTSPEAATHDGTDSQKAADRQLGEHTDSERDKDHRGPATTAIAEPPAADNPPRTPQGNGHPTNQYPACTVGQMVGWIPSACALTEAFFGKPAAFHGGSIFNTVEEFGTPHRQHGERACACTPRAHS